MPSDALYQRLNDATLSLLSSDGWQAWLRARRRFHNYSLRNQILIATQTPRRELPDGTLAQTAPAPTHVAGYQNWRNLHRQVVKGAKGIFILAPRTRKSRDDPDRRELVGVKAAYVFDVSQTEQIEGKEEIPLSPPGDWLHASGDAELAYGHLERAAERLGATARVEAIDGRARGWYDPTAHEIAVDERLDTPERCHALAHELAHHLDLVVLEPDPALGRSKPLGELIAESAAFVVCEGAGLTCPSSDYYLATWATGIDDPAAVLSAIAGRVSKIAALVEEQLAHEPADAQPVPA